MGERLCSENIWRMALGRRGTDERDKSLVRDDRWER